MQRFEANGGGQYKIICSENEGFAMFFPENLLDIGEQHYAHLCNMFGEWVKEHADRRIRSTLPIADTTGQTVILYVWWD